LTKKNLEKIQTGKPDVELKKSKDLDDVESDDWIESDQLKHPPSPPPQQTTDQSDFPADTLSSTMQQSGRKSSTNINRSLYEAKTSLNAFGRAGEYLETKVRGWYSWLGWNASNPDNRDLTSPLKSQTTSQNIEPSVRDIVVIHTNWFWKQQIRLLRFNDEEFMRVHPTTNEVKEVHRYTQVDKITITGNTFMIIYFVPTLAISPEYYESKERDLIVELITTRAQSQGRNVSLIEVFEKD